MKWIFVECLECYTGENVTHMCIYFVQDFAIEKGKKYMVII